MKNVKKTKKNLKFASLAWLLVIMLLAITIFINVAVSFFDVKMDMTPNSYYTISQQSTDYINSLDKDVEITLLADINELKADPSAHDYNAFYNILEEYDKFDRVTVKYIDPNENPEITKELDPEDLIGLKENDIAIKCNNKVKRIPGEKMFLEEKDTESCLTMSMTFVGEGYITGAIKSLNEDYTPSVYFLTGHGEKSLEKNFTQFRKMLENENYEVKELNLLIDETVPDDAAIIVVPGPEKDISDDEKTKLEKYLDKGGNLSLLLDPLNNNTDFDNLTDIMHQYCIGMDYDRVYETDDNMHYAGDKYTIVAELVSLSDDQSSNEYDITSGFISDSKSEDLTDLTSSVIDNYGAPQTPMTPSRSFFDYQGDNYGKVLLCPLIQASATAKAEAFGGDKHKTSDAELDRMNGSVEQTQNGFWLSAYGEDPTRNDSKLVVMGTSELMDDSQFASGSSSLPSQFLYLSTISWMSGSNIEMGIPEKKLTYDHMTLETQSDTNFMLAILVAAPVIVAAAGVLIWLKRRHS